MRILVSFLTITEKNKVIKDKAKRLRELFNRYLSSYRPQSNNDDLQ